MQNKIVCLVSPSGGGKTTIAKELDKLGYNIIQSFTTRKPRVDGEWGHTFVDESYYQMECKHDIIAYFNNYNSNERYWATKQQYQGLGVSIYVIDPSGAEEVKKNVKDADVVTIFLQVDADIRIDRMMKDSRRKLKDIEERLEKDQEVFKVCKCDYVVDGNRKIEKILKDIVDIIED